MAAGEHHSCALLADRTLWCWGDNLAGELGNGSLSPSSTPVKVALDNVASVSAGHGHTCAIDTEGQAWCWGRNSSGKLGNGSFDDATIPTLVAY